MLSEWMEDKNLEWYLLNEPLHDELQEYTRQLLHLYSKHEVLYKYDDDYRTFQWVNCNDADRSIFSFIRKSPENYDEALLFICNFTPVERKDYRIGVPKQRMYRMVLDSDAKVFGGNAEETKQAEYIAEPVACNGQDYSFEYCLPAYGAAVFEY